MKICVADIVDESIVDGPGIRMTIFMQGCPHHCPGCHNPHTHDPDGGYEVNVYEVIDKFRKNPLLDGITFSGGEPFEQPYALQFLSSVVQTFGKTVWCYTGWTWEEILSDEKKRKALVCIDVLVDGRFDVSQRSLAIPWRGSKNQRIIDVAKSLHNGKIVEWAAPRGPCGGETEVGK